MLFFDPDNNIFGDATISIFAGISMVIGFVLVLVVRYAFGSNENVAAAVTWGMLGNILGIGFAAISDIWINGFSLAAAVVGEFLPAAGPNLIFAAIIVPLLVAARQCRDNLVDKYLLAHRGSQTPDEQVHYVSCLAIS
jgi:hypothetical protein